MSASNLAIDLARAVILYWTPRWTDEQEAEFDRLTSREQGEPISKALVRLAERVVEGQ